MFKRRKLFQPSKFLIILFVLLLCVCTQNSRGSRPRGVPKSKAQFYEHTTSLWSCLDGSAKIPYDAINDDYCDCDDGSDEPGTSACLGGRFHCTNKGHIPAYIESYRVNDGKCEPECCDGSDEFDGKIECPNICMKVGAEHRKRLHELANMRAKGARIKKEYIEFGKKLKSDSQADLEKLEVDLVAAKQRVDERKKAFEKQKAQRRYLNKEVYRERIRKCKADNGILRDRVEKLHDDVSTLLGILKDLKANHNQNYHDMAVKTAIAGYDEFLEGEENNIDEDNTDENSTEDLEGSDESEETKIDDSESNIPQWNGPSLVEQIFDIPKTVANGFLEALGLHDFAFSTIQDYGTESSGASKEYDAAKNEEQDIQQKVNDINDKLSKDFGRQWEFAKLDNECFDHVTGEYTYTICLFGEATQKGANDHSSTNLGNFGRWIGADSPDDPAYYTKQIYENGMRCWNGPERSLTVMFECGTENTILSVTEPEKCEYLMKMNTPAVCPDQPITNSDKTRDEF